VTTPYSKPYITMSLGLTSATMNLASALGEFIIGPILATRELLAFGALGFSRQIFHQSSDIRQLKKNVCFIPYTTNTHTHTPKLIFKLYTHTHSLFIVQEDQHQHREVKT
jgi:hypothetical protein